MPSTRTPTSIQIGPGQLSDNVGSASSLVASVLTTTGAAVNVDPEAVVVLATPYMFLTRLGSRVIVVADNVAGVVEIRLPEEAQPGDTITIIQSTGSTDVLNAIRVFSSSGVNTINGQDGFETLSGYFGAKTYVNVAKSGDALKSWVSTSEKAVVESSSISLTLYRSEKQFIIVDPTAGSRVVSLPVAAKAGDTVVVINPTDSTNLISVIGSIDGSGGRSLRQMRSATSFVAIGANQWVTLCLTGPSVVTTAASMTVNVARETFVFVDSTAGPIPIYLPEDARIGDSIMVVDASGAASTNAINVSASFTGSDNIMGVASLVWSINDNFGSMTLVRASTTVWIVRQKTTPLLVSVSNSTTGLARRGPDMRVFVDTSQTSWTGTGPQDTIMTPLLPATGDRFTVCDVGGQADVKHITIVGDGTCVIGESPSSGASQVRIAKRFGTITLIFTGKDNRWIEESTSNINPFVLVTDTAVLERYGRDFTVQVDTLHGNWTSAKTITLPSTATQAMKGDTVTIVDVGGQAGATADSITVLPSSGGLNINGLASFLLGANYGSTTFCYIGGNNWVTGNTGADAFPVIALADTGSVIRMAPSTLVLVNTAPLAWTNAKVVTLPAAAAMRVGDEVTVTDSGGEASSLLKFITVQAAAAGTIGGAANYTIMESYGSATFRHVGSGNWLVTALTARTATAVLYAPAVSADWRDPDPANVGEALDAMAIMVKSAVERAALCNWRPETSGTAQSLLGLAWNGTLFVVVGNAGTILTSPDGITWTSRTSGTAEDQFGVTFRGSTFVAVGSAGTIRYSTNGITWTPVTSGTIEALNGIGSNQAIFVAVGSNGTIRRSNDLTTWSASTSGVGDTLRGVAWNGTLFVVVGNAGTILTSPIDGITWTSRTSGTAQSLIGITWNGTLFVVVGNAGTILTSPDGITWTSRTSGTAVDLKSVEKTEHHLVAGGNSGTLLLSPDGIVWQLTDVITTNSFLALRWSGRVGIAVGAAGMIQRSFRTAA